MPTTIGLLYPGFAAEDDFASLETRLDQTSPNEAIRLPLVHTSVGEDAHRLDALLDLGSVERLADGGRALVEHEPDSVMWACTSGSFVFGWEGARTQVAAISDNLGVPASSTSIAFVNAVQALGVTTVAIAASYPHDVAAYFAEFLDRGSIKVAAMGSHEIVTAAEVGRLRQENVVAMVYAADRPDAEAVLVPDTAMHSLAWLDDLEEATGKPVLTANQVTVWEGLRLAGTIPRLDGLGSLFRR